MGFLDWLDNLITHGHPEGKDPRCGQAWPGMPWDESAGMVETPRLRGETFQEHEFRMASERWRRGNLAKKEAGCQCGFPSTQVTFDYRNKGSVPVEFWTCDDHVGVSSWASWGPDGQWIAYWPQGRCLTCVLGDCKGHVRDASGKMIKFQR